MCCQALSNLLGCEIADLSEIDRKLGNLCIRAFEDSGYEHLEHAGGMVPSRRDLQSDSAWSMSSLSSSSYLNDSFRRLAKLMRSPKMWSRSCANR